jgi:hypothetical protein
VAPCCWTRDDALAAARPGGVVARQTLSGSRLINRPHVVVPRTRRVSSPKVLGVQGLRVRLLVNVPVTSKSASGPDVALSRIVPVACRSSRVPDLAVSVKSKTFR